MPDQPVRETVSRFAISNVITEPGEDVKRIYEKLSAEKSEVLILTGKDVLALDLADLKYILHHGLSTADFAATDDKNSGT